MRLLIWAKTGSTGPRFRHQPPRQFLPDVRIPVSVPVIGKVFGQSACLMRYAHQLPEGSSQ